MQLSRRRALAGGASAALIAGAMAAVTATATPPPPPNLVADPGFEDHVISPAGNTYEEFDASGGSVAVSDGWTATAGSVDLVTAPYPVHSGNQALDLNGSGEGTISQTFSTVSGHSYRLSYWVNTNGGDGVALHGAWTSGAVESEGDYTYNGGGSWVQLAGTFLAGASSTTLTIASTTPGQGGAVLDDFSVTDSSPTANAQSVSTNHDTALPVTLAGSDPTAGESISFKVTSLPTHGSLTDGATPITTVPTLLSGNGVTYTPNAGYQGPDSFNFAASDGVADSAVAQVSISVIGAPTATNDSYITPMNTQLNVAAPGLLANDSDTNLLPLTAHLVSGPSHAAPSSFALNPDGSFSYKPARNYHGFDSFTYYASNGTFDSSSATVTIAADTAPVANNDAYQLGVDSSISVSAPGVLGNDTDANNDLLDAVLVSMPSHADAGSFALHSDGSFTYAGAPGYRGQDSFTYKANDGYADSNVATVTITVDTAPVANPNGYLATEGTLLHATTSVLANDTDADGDTLSVVSHTNPAHGTLMMNADGTFDYTPVANYIGSDSFTYVATDGFENSNSTTVSLTVQWDGIYDPTNLSYNGPGSVKIGSSFTAKASVTSPDPNCLGGRSVTFDFGPGTQATGVSSSSGAVSVTVPGTVTKGWTAGNWVVNLTTNNVAEANGGGGQCASGASSTKFKVTGK